jgi:CRP-like cAMP-binding protein
MRSYVQVLVPEVVVAILGANDFFGEGCLAGQRNRMATAMAMAEFSRSVEPMNRVTPDNVGANGA